MIAGIIGNTAKENICGVLHSLVNALAVNSITPLIADNLKPILSEGKITAEYFEPLNDLGKKSDVLISIGGDGTMLSSSIVAHENDKPIIGLNLGKLGFLAEVDISHVETFCRELKEGNYYIDEHMALRGFCDTDKETQFLAFNDFVIDKGGWPKMIEITMQVGDEYVTTFSADGLIISTPTGSTGYSLSIGGPIVNPKTDVITLNPISPHSLTMRPLIIPGSSVVTVGVASHHSKVQINCDGHLVYNYAPPIFFHVKQSSKKLKVMRTPSYQYFSILRNKLLWGLDIRQKDIKG